MHDLPRHHASLIITIVCALSLSLFGRTTTAVEPCRIQIVDADNGWPVPLVELKTTHHIRFVSDNAGVIAFDLPELMNRETWFHIEGHGYSVPPDGFGYKGIRIVPQPGGKHTIKVQRQLPAKRLGRITGGGLFAESQKLGEHADWTEQGILGCDSVQNAVHGDRLFWGWGDTVLPHYPLGRFHMIGATTKRKPLESLRPPVKLRYDYFCDNNAVPRNVAKLPGDGPTWLFGFVSLPDQHGNRILGATYSKIEAPLAEYETGLCVWNVERENFEVHVVLWKRTAAEPNPPATPTGHAVFWTDESGADVVLFGNTFPTVKCGARFEEWSNPKTWDILTPQTTVPTAAGAVEITPHRSAIAWNAYRNKWVTVFTQKNGSSSALGEIWYAECDAPTGPWSGAVKVVTHQKYTFYNPQLHPEFVDAGSPVLLFEATYTHAFSNTRDPTPRHDYNQVLYRLDLDQLANH